MDRITDRVRSVHAGRIAFNMTGYSGFIELQSTCRVIIKLLFSDDVYWIFRAIRWYIFIMTVHLLTTCKLINKSTIGATMKELTRSICTNNEREIEGELIDIDTVL